MGDNGGHVRYTHGRNPQTLPDQESIVVRSGKLILRRFSQFIKIGQVFKIKKNCGNKIQIFFSDLLCRKVRGIPEKSFPIFLFKKIFHQSQ